MSCFTLDPAIFLLPSAPNTLVTSLWDTSSTVLRSLCGALPPPPVRMVTSYLLFTSAKEVMFSVALVCLFVCKINEKVMNRF